jgi:hypothetical protein
MQVNTIDTGVTASFMFFTDASNWSSISYTFVDAAYHYFNFEDVIAEAGTGVDFTNVGAIHMRLEGTSSWDGSVDLLQTVPAPATTALLAVGLLGFFRGARSVNVRHAPCDPSSSAAPGVRGS